MRIALLGRRLHSPGGSEQSLITLAEHLSNHHTVRIFGFADGVVATSVDTRTIPGKYYCIDTIPEETSRLCRFIRGSLHLRGPLESFEPDLLISQHELSLVGATSDVSQIPHVAFIQDTSVIPGRGPSRERLSRYVNAPFERVNTRLFGHALGRIDLTVASSEYLARQFEDAWTRETAVVHPFIKGTREVKNDYDVQFEVRDAILHVTPSIPKGIEITLDIARNLPHEEFIIVGNPPMDAIRQKMSELENVHFLGYVEEMAAVYDRSRIVLMPSLVEESYGIVPVEAGLQGIPTLHSGRGGLEESAGLPELAVDSDDPDAYVEKIAEIDEEYEKYSQRARDSAENRLAPAEFAKFGDLLADRLNLAVDGLDRQTR